MPTTTEIAGISQRIYNAAKSGTPTNTKGLPDTLAALLVAQSKHETGNFTSNAYKTANNGFGYMYVNGAKWQLAQPGLIADNGKPVARYASIEDSTKEIVDWIYRRVKQGVFPANLDSVDTPEKYAELLKKAGYYGDSLENYLTGLKRWVTEIIGEVSAELVLFSIIGAVYIVRNKKNPETVSLKR